MQISVVRNYLDYSGNEALILPFNHKSTWSEAYSPTSMLACGGMFHFKATELFRRYPLVTTAVIRPTIEGVNDVRNIVFVRDDVLTSPLSVTMHRALSRAHRSGFQKVIMPLLRFNWFVKDSEPALEAWTRDYLTALLECRTASSCQVAELVIVANDDQVLQRWLRQTLQILNLS